MPKETIHLNTALGVACASTLPWLVPMHVFGVNTTHPVRPNIIVMVADDLGYGDVSFMVRKVVATPNIDRLAKSGVTFTSGYATCPLCAPSRVGFLTGRYNQRAGAENNNSVPAIPSDVPIFSEIFKQAGYTTGLLGKWHPGSNKPGQRPFDRGFTEFYGYYSPFLNYRKPKLFRNEQLVAEKEYSTDAFALEAEQFIEKHRNAPFFLNVAFNAPHIACTSKNSVIGKKTLKANPAEFKREQKSGKFKEFMSRIGEDQKFLQQFENDWARADTVACITALDQAVGRIMDKLHKTGLDRNTIVFFFSDNGGHPENRSENLPLSGYKWSVNEGGIRVPFLASYPAVFPAGLTYYKPVMTFDILPTCAALARVKTPDNLDGVNLAPYLTGQETTAPHDALYWRITMHGNMQRAMRKGPWKLLMAKNTSPELFEIEKDCEEKHDVAAQHPEVVAELKQAWQTWSASVGDPQETASKKGNDEE